MCIRDRYSPVNMTGDADWIAQIKNTYDGEDAAESGSISGDQSSNFSISERTTSVSFWYKVSSENNYDFFEFYIDGSREIRKSGDVGWTQFTNGSLGNTNHPFEWRYTKDGYVDAGSDKAWGDKVVFDQNGGYQEWSNTNSASDSGEVDSDGDGIILWEDLVQMFASPEKKKKKARRRREDGMRINRKAFPSEGPEGGERGSEPGMKSRAAAGSRKRRWTSGRSGGLARRSRLNLRREGKRRMRTPETNEGRQRRS